MKSRGLRIGSFWVAILMLSPSLAMTDDACDVFSLETVVEKAVEVNIGLRISEEEIRAAQSVRQIRRTRFLPTLGAEYSYRRIDDSVSAPGIGTITPNDQYTFSVSITQPIFSGFSLINQYRSALLEVETAGWKEIQTRRDIVLEAQQIYFSLLKAQKLESVSGKTIEQISAQETVARNFYEIDMIPLNDLLQVQVELANARQAQVVALNNLDTARSALNILLRRPVNSPVRIEDIQDYRPFEHGIDYCMDSAREQRIEIRLADLLIQLAEKDVNIAKKDYFPTVNLKGVYSRLGDEPDTSGDTGISDPDVWEISASAVWNFWEWGRTRSTVNEKKHRLAKARHQKEQLIDDIVLQVKQAYLKVRETEKNIKTIEQAIGQARENFRINQERYRNQVATSTDVLDAQTLLAKTMTNYFTALYDFKIAKASLLWAIGSS